MVKLAVLSVQLEQAHLLVVITVHLVPWEPIRAQVPFSALNARAQVIQLQWQAAVLIRRPTARQDPMLPIQLQDVLYAQQELHRR